MNRIKTVLVDDHRVVRQGLVSYLGAFPDIEVVGTASSGEELLTQLEKWSPDVVVMDILMPGGIEGIEATRRARLISPHSQVIMLTGFNDDARVIAALRAGAIGYLRKDSDPELLLSAIRAAARGQSILDPTVAGTVLQDLLKGGPSNSLTEREQEVLRQVTKGRSNKEIGQLLVISEETVKTHVGNILSKLHLSHRTQAMLYALKQGLVSLDEIDPTR